MGESAKAEHPSHGRTRMRDPASAVRLDELSEAEDLLCCQHARGAGLMAVPENAAAPEAASRWFVAQASSRLIGMDAALSPVSDWQIAVRAPLRTHNLLPFEVTLQTWPAEGGGRERMGEEGQGMDDCMERVAVRSGAESGICSVGPGGAFLLAVTSATWRPAQEVSECCELGSE